MTNTQIKLASEENTQIEIIDSVQSLYGKTFAIGLDATDGYCFGQIVKGEFHLLMWTLGLGHAQRKLSNVTTR